MGNELFLPEYTLGALDSIGSVAQVIGMFTVMVISFVGFGIVNSAIIKNALNGWYWTSPRLWDKVDEVKRAKLGIKDRSDAASKATGYSNDNQVMELLGTISAFIFSLLPNVKEMSEFGKKENGKEVKVDPKQYFMKAIPLFVAQVFIGVFIYCGYPMKTAEYFKDIGTGVYDLILDNTDPVAFVEKLPSNFARYSLSTSTARDDISKVTNSATKKAISAYFGVYTDVKKEKRNEVALGIESWLLQEFQNKAEYCDSDKYSYAVTAQIDNIDLDMTKFNDVTDDEGVYQVAFKIPAEQIDSGTTMQTTGRWLRVNTTFTPVASKGDIKSVDCALTVANSSGSYNDSTKTFTIDLGVSSGAGFKLSTLSAVSGEAVTNSGNVNVKITVSGTKITVAPKKKSDSLAGLTSIESVSGLKYTYGTSSHPIKSINLNGSGSPVFTPVDSESGIKSWSWGESPVKSSDKSSSNTDEGSDRKPSTSDDDLM